MPSRKKSTAVSSALVVPAEQSEALASLDNDPRLVKREMKEKTKNSTLVWRRGKFASDELDQLQKAVFSWISDRGLSKEEGFTQLMWGRDNNLNRVWCDIGQRSGLFMRSLENIRKAAIRHIMREKKPWTAEEKERFRDLQGVHGERSWKAIAKELGRTLEETQSMGKLLLRAGPKAEFRQQKKTTKKQLIPVTSERFTETERHILVAMRNVSDYTKFPVHNISWTPISSAMSVDADARRVVSEMYGDMLRKCGLIVDKAHPDLIDRCILYNLYLGVKGKLTAWVFTDLESVDWPLVCPFLPLRDAKARVLARLKACGVPDFIAAVRQTKRTLKLSQADVDAGATAAELIQFTLQSVLDFTLPAALVD